ncbi:hypothetical protein J7J13_03830 [bacterium]|nr:hypothetical protein [bacterium]
MKKQILKYSLIFLTLLFSFFAWLSVDQAVNNPESSNWLVPVIWFSLFFIILALSIVLIKETYVLTGLLAVSFLSSFIFVFNGWHFLPVVLSLLLAYLAMARIKNDLKLNVKIDLWKTIRRGRMLLIISLAIIITSQYYFGVKDFKASALIPQLKPGDIANGLASRIISTINPGIKISEDKDMTVDQFILQTQKMNDQKNAGISVDKEIDKIVAEKFGDTASPSRLDEIKKEYAKNMEEPDGRNMILEEGRKQLSEIAGRELAGEEKISEVISEMINSKITNFLGVSMDNPKKVPLIPIALAIIIFLTVISLGSFLSPLWMLLSALIFTILAKTKIIQIKKVPVEMEIIE